MKGGAFIGRCGRKKTAFFVLDKYHRRHNEGRFVQVLATASLRSIKCKVQIMKVDGIHIPCSGVRASAISYAYR